ncbi:hypothetical protein TSUD_241700 [Trifolium subterraneum]|uniref:Uncharacterized protein n=1 Tax=Trifolium subterraneum TaxID=3900 RepID=A0A2Z6PHK4_TRISU|nr:hypothetical protein TSUD_241700 [Trifolium subterraneum]
MTEFTTEIIGASLKLCFIFSSACFVILCSLINSVTSMYLSIISPLNVVQQADVVENSDTSRFDLDWLTFDGLGQGLDDLDCLDDLQYCDFDNYNGPIDIPNFNFDDIIGADESVADEIDSWFEDSPNKPCP